MKKAFIAMLALVILMPLAFSASAAEGQLISISVTATLPVAGKMPNAVQDKDIKIIAEMDDKLETLTVRQDFELAMAGSYWQEKESSATVFGPFVAGREYRLVVPINLIGEDLTVTGETEITVGGKKAELKTMGTDGKNLEIVCNFVCAPQDITPKVSLTVEGEKAKEYDGKGIVLKALVERHDGVEYRFEWYKDSVLVPDAQESQLVVRDVLDSGKYYCKVLARVSGETQGEVYTSITAAHTIEILPRTVTVIIGNAEKNLFDPDPTFTYEFLGEVDENDKKAITGSLARVPGEDIGKYEILIGTLAFPEKIAANYQILVKQGTLTILSAGELPFSDVANVADLSYIKGQNGSKIRISASKGAIPEGGILSLGTADEEIRLTLVDYMNRDLMKSFTVNLLDANGRAVKLPNHASLRIQIPLTQEEGDQDPETILAAFYDTSSQKLPAQVVSGDGVTYIAVEIEALGVVALFDGELLPSVSQGGENKTPPGKVSGSLWMWILIGVLSFLALGAIAFTVVWTRMNAPAKKEPGKKPNADKGFAPQKGVKPVSGAHLTTNREKEEKERVRRIAEKINAMPPVPKKEEKPKEEKKPETTSSHRIISFEDLED